MTTSVLVTDDHPLFRGGLVALLRASGYEVAGEAASGTEAIALASALRPDIAVMDLGLPDMTGHEAIGRMLAERPELRIVVLSMFDDDASVRQALDAGALGYVVKDAPPEQVLTAIRATELGASMLGSGLKRPAPAVPVPSPALSGMTPRERAVAALLAQGLPNRLIAARLDVSEKTVANYVSTVLFKLGADNRYDAGRIVRGSTNGRAVGGSDRD